MTRRLYGFIGILMVIAVAGCGMGKTLVAKQEWSENYALAEGVEATSPQMVDGNRRTTGESQTPAGKAGSRGITNYTEAVVTLPEKKSIRRIDLYTDNIQSMSIHAAGRDENTWVLLDEVKNNRDKMISFKVSTTTEKIKVRVRETSDDTLRPGGRGRNRNRMQRAKGKIQEIEIYGLAEAHAEEAEEAEMVEEEVESFGTDAVFTTPEADKVKQQSAALDTSAATIVPTKKTEAKAISESKTAAKTEVVKPKPKPKLKPKAPPASTKLESAQNTYALAGPVPVKVSVKIGPDDIVVLDDSMKDEMLFTKFVVKNASGEQIACSKPAPKISRARPYRGSGREVNVRDARTLDADSIFTLDVANLLEYYSITEPGSYTVQFDMNLGVYAMFVGRNQTQIQDLERTMRGINSRANYSQTEKATLISGLQEDINKLKKDKSHRYIVVGSRRKSLALKSNVLELTIQ